MEGFKRVKHTGFPPSSSSEVEMSSPSGLKNVLSHDTLTELTLIMCRDGEREGGKGESDREGGGRGEK